MDVFLPLFFPSPLSKNKINKIVKKKLKKERPPYLGDCSPACLPQSGSAWALCPLYLLRWNIPTQDLLSPHGLPSQATFCSGAQA